MTEGIPPSGFAVQWHELNPRPTAIRRLIVLLPDAEINEALLARALWSLSAPGGAHIHIIAKVDDWATEGLVRLRLAMVTALLRESAIEPTTQLETSSAEWPQLVRRQSLPGDVIVCDAGQKLPVHAHGLDVTFKPLGDYFAAMRMPVCVVHGMLRHQPPMTPGRMVKTWVVPLLIIFVSVALEALFLHWARDWAEGARQGILAAYTAVEIAAVAWLAKS
jgi:hypothetical protein